MTKPTDADRLLAVLADHREHDHRELYRLGMIVHSRISDLRKRGHRIDQRREGDLYLYRLAPGVLPEPPNPAAFHVHGSDAGHATIAVPRQGGGSGNTQVRGDVEQLVLGAA